MPQKYRYINAEEAAKLGLPLRYGDIVDGKKFQNYKENIKTGSIVREHITEKRKISRRRKETRKRARIQLFVTRVKMRYGCAICGYKKHGAALHFNHLNQDKKKKNVSKCKSFLSVKEEMRKCEILCANCHAEKTIEEKHYLYERKK
jgi:hypothetical protein